MNPDKMRKMQIVGNTGLSAAYVSYLSGFSFGIATFALASPPPNFRPLLEWSGQHILDYSNWLLFEIGEETRPDRMSGRMPTLSIDDLYFNRYSHPAEWRNQIEGIHLIDLYIRSLREETAKGEDMGIDEIKRIICEINIAIYGNDGRNELKNQFGLK